MSSESSIEDVCVKEVVVRGIGVFVDGKMTEFIKESIKYTEPADDCLFGIGDNVIYSKPMHSWSTGEFRVIHKELFGIEGKVIDISADGLVFVDYPNGIRQHFMALRLSPATEKNLRMANRRLRLIEKRHSGTTKPLRHRSRSPIHTRSRHNSE